jgi:hypothetical protein
LKLRSIVVTPGVWPPSRYLLRPHGIHRILAPAGSPARRGFAFNGSPLRRSSQWLPQQAAGSILSGLHRPQPPPSAPRQPQRYKIRAESCRCAHRAALLTQAPRRAFGTFCGRLPEPSGMAPPTGSWLRISRPMARACGCAPLPRTPPVPGHG